MTLGKQRSCILQNNMLHTYVRLNMLLSPFIGEPLFATGENGGRYGTKGDPLEPSVG
jgi:hypothetical protein